MLRLKNEWSSLVEDDILKFFYAQYYAPLVKILGLKKPIYNANSAVIDAIRSGRIQYRDGVFSGKFDVKTSRELSSFARFDARSKIWKGYPGPDTLAASLIANAHRATLIHELDTAISEVENTITEAIDSLRLGRDLPLFEMDSAVRVSIEPKKKLPALDLDTATVLRENYTAAQNRNIKGWTDEQVSRLREMVNHIQTKSDNASIQAAIQSEWATSAAKAKFLATQETRLFFSDYSLVRARTAGITKYIWSTSHDERVRESHRELDGKVIRLDDPPVVDKRTGRKAHAGEDYSCRCVKKWVLE